MTTIFRFSSRFGWLLRGTALAAAPLLLTACGQGAQQAAPTGEPSDQSGEAAMTASAPAPEQAAPVVDESAAAPLTDVVPVPVAAQADPAAAAPLQDAATITTEISRGSGIERIRHGDGWAWMQNGKIIRTASSDGKRVAYFKNGSDTPFLVQDDRQAYAYSGGKVTHHYDNGQAKTIDNGDRKDADKLISKAKNDRDTAAHVAATNPVRHATRPAPTPTPTRSSAVHDTSHHHDAIPTPTPTPTHSMHESSHMTSGGGRTSDSTMRGTSSSTMRSSHSSSTMRSMRPSPTPTPS